MRASCASSKKNQNVIKLKYAHIFLHTTLKQFSRNETRNNLIRDHPVKCQNTSSEWDSVITRQWSVNESKMTLHKVWTQDRCHESSSISNLLKRRLHTFITIRELLESAHTIPTPFWTGRKKVYPARVLCMSGKILLRDEVFFVSWRK